MLQAGKVDPGVADLDRTGASRNSASPLNASTIIDRIFCAYDYDHTYYKQTSTNGVGSSCLWKYSRDPHSRATQLALYRIA